KRLVVQPIRRLGRFDVQPNPVRVLIVIDQICETTPLKKRVKQSLRVLMGQVQRQMVQQIVAIDRPCSLQHAQYGLYHANRFDPLREKLLLDRGGRVDELPTLRSQDDEPAWRIYELEHFGRDHNLGNVAKFLARARGELEEIHLAAVTGKQL